MKLSVIIPVYNEAKTLPQILERVKSVHMDHCAIEIILVNDGSTDQSPQQLLTISKAFGATLLNHAKNLGKGAAIVTGLKETRGDYVIIQDADLEYDPQDYKILLQVLLDGQADVAYGSRFLGNNNQQMYATHRTANHLLTFFTNLLYGASLTDMETCYKMAPAPLLRNLTLRSKRFEFEPELTSKLLKNGYCIKEVPISYTGRRFREGKKISMLDGLIAVWTLIRYRFSD